MITREALLALGELKIRPVRDSVPPMSGNTFCCIGCWSMFLQEDVVFSDNGTVCLNCLKALADSYFDR